VLVLASIAVGLTALRLVSPRQLDQMPRTCLWSWLLGRPCPGCGTLHALCALLHGDFSQALAYNPNVVLVAPLLLIIALAQVRFLWRCRRRSASVLSSEAIMS
jgi:hypothetical protein